MFSFLGAPLGVAYHVVFALAEVFAPVAGSLATAAAIVVFTMAVRLLLIPLSYRAHRGQASISTFQVKAQELRRRYPNQPDRLQRELTELYRQEGSGLLAGCLPLLIQLPFFSIMYRLFVSKTVSGQANRLLSRDLLSTPLGSHWLSGAGPVSTQGLLFLVLFALLAAVAYAATRAARATAPPAGAQPAGAQPAAVAVLTNALPYVTLIVAAFVPLAAGIYLLTTTSWTVAERAVLRRLARVSSAAGARDAPGHAR